MSDFLGQLIERSVTMAATATVKPRPAAAFEQIFAPPWSADPGPSAATDAGAAIERDGREAARDNPSEVMTHVPVVSSNLVDHGNEWAVDGRSTRSDADQARPMQPRISAVPAELAASPARESSWQALPDPAPTELRPRAASSMTARQDAASTHPIIRETSLESRMTRERLIEPTVGRERGRDVIREDPETGEPTLPSMIRRMITQPIGREESRGRIIESTPGEPSRMIRAKPESSVPSRELRLESPATPQLTPARRPFDADTREALRPRADLTVPAPQPAPRGSTTVNVRIGRIEVRAVQREAPPPPAATKRATRPHVMSLDEYLGQRARTSG